MPNRSQILIPQLEAMLAGSRSRSSWNERFQHWERPASETEEVQINRSAGMVQGAFNDNAWLVKEGVQIRPQGSYHNNTNVRQDSDMDLCAWHPGIEVMVEHGLSDEEVNRWLGYTYNGRMISDISVELRRAVDYALRAKFGTANVKEGNKAFRVSAVSGSRTDADVVPAIRLHYVRRQGTGLLCPLECIEGVIVYAKDGTTDPELPAATPRERQGQEGAYRPPF